MTAVNGPESSEEFAEPSAKEKRPTLGESFAELRKLVEEEGYRLEIPRRKNRMNIFPEVLDELPR